MPKEKLEGFRMVYIRTVIYFDTIDCRGSSVSLNGVNAIFIQG